MLHRFTIWLRHCWQKLPVQLSIFGWPPILSHGLMFVIGTLVVRHPGDIMRLPESKILLPLDRLAQLDEKKSAGRLPQNMHLLLRQEERWCRLADDPLKIWRAPGPNDAAFVLWSSAPDAASKLKQLLERRLALSAHAERFSFCGPRASDVSGAVTYGINYD